MIEAVFFDLYETLINEIRTYTKPWPSTAGLLGIEDEVFVVERRKRTHGLMTGKYNDFASVLREICVSVGRPVDEEVIAQIQTTRAGFHRSLFAGVEDDVTQVLQAVRKMGLKTGLISNATPDETSEFASYPLADLLDCIVFSYQAGSMKPDPAIYLLACEKLAVNPERCVFVGDGSHDELAGAAAVGMKPYQAAWFVERWPEDVRRQHARWDGDYPKLATPGALVAAVQSMRGTR